MRSMGGTGGIIAHPVCWGRAVVDSTLRTSTAHVDCGPRIVAWDPWASEPAHPSIRRSPMVFGMAKHIDDDHNTTGHTTALTEELDGERAIATRQMCELLGIAPITAAQWRQRGEGPRFFRVGKRHVRYRLGDVLAFRDARMVGRRSAP